MSNKMMSNNNKVLTMIVYYRPTYHVSLYPLRKTYGDFHFPSSVISATNLFSLHVLIIFRKLNNYFMHLLDYLLS